MMSDLHAGDKLAPPGNPNNYFEILDGRLHAGTVEVFEAEKHQSRYVSFEEIRERISDGTLILHRKGKPRVSIATQADNPSLRSHVNHLSNALRRIEEIRKRYRLSFAAAIPRAREDYLKENEDKPFCDAFPSQATLYRAHRNRLHGLPILKGDKNKGNAVARYSTDLVDFVKDVIDRYYLVTESKWTVLKVTDYVNREARRRGLHMATTAISRKFICAKIDELTADGDYDRMDPLKRIAGKSFAKKRIRAGSPFARIEQDAVHLPFVVTTPHGISRNVYLVHAVDVCTGYPVGWHLVIGAPREMDSLMCLKMYLTSAKSTRFKELGIEHAIDLFGTPGQVIFDNGPETKGSRIVRLEIIEVDVKHCKAKEAQGKPFIERLNRSLKEALELLEGCTRFEGKDGVRDPEALGDKLMSIEELEKWIVRWLYNDWVNSPLERLRWDELILGSVKGKTPLERVRYYTEELGQPITLPPPQHEWMAAIFERKSCTLSAKSGITVDKGFRYRGDNMSYLLGKYGDHAQLDIVYDPDDFRQVYVHEASDLPLVKLTHIHVQPATPAWTFKEAKARFDAGMEDWVAPDDKLQFERDLDDAVTSSQPGRKRKSRGKREENAETVRLAKKGRAIQGAIDRPLSTAAPFGPTASTNTVPFDSDTQSPEISYDDAPVMNIVNRSTGEKLL